MRPVLTCQAHFPLRYSSHCNPLEITSALFQNVVLGLRQCGTCFVAPVFACVTFCCLFTCHTKPRLLPPFACTFCTPMFSLGSGTFSSSGWHVESMPSIAQSSRGFIDQRKVNPFGSLYIDVFMRG